MNALPTSIRRDDFGWAPLSPKTIEVFRSPVEESGSGAEIIPFRPVPPPANPWQDLLDLESSLPPMAVAGELRTKEHDPRFLVDPCVIQRVRHSTGSATYRMDFPSNHQPVFVTVMPAILDIANSKPAAPAIHLTAILHGGHLMERFGFRIVALLAIQLLSAWMVGAVVGEAMGAGRYFHSAAWLFLMLASNVHIWIRYYGREPKDFHVPGIGLFLAAILPVGLLHYLVFLRP